MNVSDSLNVFSHPSFSWVDLPVTLFCVQEHSGSHKFSSSLS